MNGNYDMPAGFEAFVEQRMEEMFEEATKIQGQVDAAQKAGKNVTSVMGPPDTKTGDIIDVMRYNEENPEGDPETKRKARVLHTMPIDLVNKDTGGIWHGSEVLCVLLDDEDVTTEEEFKAMYGEGDAEDVEVQDPPEVSGEEVPVESVPPVSTVVEVTVNPVDPNECECGADREMCGRNQDMLGYHLNES